MNKQFSKPQPAVLREGGREGLIVRAGFSRDRSLPHPLSGDHLALARATALTLDASAMMTTAT
jgi:hypothetical protein